MATDAAGTDEREDLAELRAGAAGLVAGLGVFFLGRYLSVGAGASLRAAILEAPFLLLALSLLYAGVWLFRSDICPRRVGCVAGWSFAGFLALVAIGVWIGAGGSGPIHRSALLTLDVGAVGASSGLLVGLENERRQRRVDRDAIEASLAAERAEERFAFFNRLLRHHLLNGLAVVRGHAELLSAAQDDPPEEVRIIQRRSDEIVALVRNVETLARAAAGDLPRYAVDPVPQLRDAVRTIRHEQPAAAIDLDVVACGHVVGNDQIGIAFEAILRTVVEAADGDAVVVETVAREGAIVVHVGLEGSSAGGAILGGDPSTRSESDLGYFLAETLIEYFGGTVDEPVEGWSGLSISLPLAEQPRFAN